MWNCTGWQGCTLSTRLERSRCTSGQRLSMMIPRSAWLCRNPFSPKLSNTALTISNMPQLKVYNVANDFLEITLCKGIPISIECWYLQRYKITNIRYTNKDFIGPQFPVSEDKMVIVDDAAIKQFSERYYSDLNTVSSVEWIRTNRATCAEHSLCLYTSSCNVFECILIHVSRVLLQLKKSNNPLRRLFHSNCTNKYL